MSSSRKSDLKRFNYQIDIADSRIKLTASSFNVLTTLPGAPRTIELSGISTFSVISA